MSEIILSELKEQADAVIKLAETARQRIWILSHALEPEFYDQTEFISICKNLVISHSQCHIRLLIQNNENLRKMDHRLLSLMNRLPSSIELKVCHQEYRHHPETFMLTDDKGLFLKRTPGRSKAFLYMDNRLVNEEYSRLFQSIWDQSDHDITLSQLSL